MQKKEGLGVKVCSKVPIFCGIVVIVNSGDDKSTAQQEPSFEVVLFYASSSSQNSPAVFPSRRALLIIGREALDIAGKCFLRAN